MMPKKQSISANLVRSLFNYDAESGNLIWKYREDMPNSWNARYANKIAGGPQNKGYFRVAINGTRYLSHRIIWLLVHGEWPKNIIDHANGDRSDNRICNLREATYSDNNANRKPRNPSKYKGVFKWDNDGRNVYYVARIAKNHKVCSLGYFKTPEEAYDAYCKAASDIHGEFFKSN